MVSVFSVRSRAIGSVFDELVAFFRPTYAHVREEKQRLDLMREEEGDAAPPVRIGEADVRMSVPDDYQGEAVKACVQLKPGANVGGDELIAYAKDKIGSMKAPKSIEFVDSLPRSPVGKVLKKDLRAKYWQNVDRRI